MTENQTPQDVDQGAPAQASATTDAQAVAPEAAQSTPPAGAVVAETPAQAGEVSDVLLADPQPIVGDLPIEPTGAALDDLAEPEAAPVDASSPKDRHDAWCAARISDGWGYGNALDGVARTDPRLVHFDNLTDEQKAAYA